MPFYWSCLTGEFVVFDTFPWLFMIHLALLVFYFFKKLGLDYLFKVETLDLLLKNLLSAAYWLGDLSYELFCLELKRGTTFPKEAPSRSRIQTRRPMAAVKSRVRCSLSHCNRTTSAAGPGHLLRLRRRRNEGIPNSCSPDYGGYRSSH